MYARSLSQVARQVKMIVSGYDELTFQASSRIGTMLQKYSELIRPWAEHTASKMIGIIDRQDKTAWQRHASTMGRALMQEIVDAPTGQVLREMLTDQVDLITSLPLRAAKRVHHLTLQGIITGERADSVIADIMQTGDVTEGQAKTIATTEVARTSSKLVETRAKHVGSEAYIWRTAEDSDVRESHKEMNGKVVRWDTPPTLSDGTTTHAGQIYNCRCYPEPIIPDVKVIK